MALLQTLKKKYLEILQPVQQGLSQIGNAVSQDVQRMPQVRTFNAIRQAPPVQQFQNTVMNTRFAPGQKNTLNQIGQNIRQDPSKYILSSSLAQGRLGTGNRFADRNIVKPTGQALNSLINTSSLGFVNPPSAKANTIPEKIGAGIGFGAGLLNPYGLAPKALGPLGKMGEKYTAILAPKALSKAPQVTQNIVKALGGEVAQSLGYVGAKKALGQDADLKTDLLAGIGLRGGFGVAGKALKGYSPNAYNVHPDDIAVMDDFIRRVRGGGAKSNLGKAGKDAQRLAEHYVGAKAKDLSNAKLAKVFESLINNAEGQPSKFPALGLVDGKKNVAGVGDSGVRAKPITKEAIKLADAIDHPDLFKKYPEFQNIDFRLTNSTTGIRSGGAGGAYYPGGNGRIEIGKEGWDLINGKKQLNKTGISRLFHEIEHAKQSKAGISLSPDERELAAFQAQSKYGERYAPQPKSNVANAGLYDKGNYLYHGTSETALENISKEGLKPGRHTGNVSLSPEESYAQNWAKGGITPQGKTEGVMLRVNKNLLKTEILPSKSGVKSDQLNELISKKVIPPEAIEIKVNGQWQPLFHVAEQPIHDIANQRVISQVSRQMEAPQPVLNTASKLQGGESSGVSVQEKILPQQPNLAQSVNQPQGKIVKALQHGSPQGKSPSSVDDIITQGKKEIGKLSDEPKKPLKQVADDLYTQWVDRFHPIMKLADRIEKKGKEMGFDIRPEHNPRYTIRKFMGMGSKAEQQFDTELKPILNKLEEMKIDKGDMDLYLKSRREVGFGSVGREIYGSDPVLAQQRVSALEAKYGEGIKPIADEIYNYQNKGFKELVDAGFIDEATGQAIRQQNPDYVPFARKIDDQLDEFLGIPSKSVQQGKNPINKIKGSDKQIYSPIESVIADTFRHRSAIEKNNVARSIVGLQKIVPELKFEKVAKAGNDAITVWENGQKSYYKVGEEIASAVKGLNEESLGTLSKILAIPSSILRQGATGRNPEFMLPNIARDQLEAGINSKYGYIPFWDYAKGLSHVLAKDDVYRQWKSSGASQSFGELSGRKSIQKMFDEKKAKGNIFRWLAKGLDAMGKLSEEPTRVGLFNKALRKTGNESLAVMESRDSTLDFSRMGSKMKVANSIVPFLNVGIQGFDRIIRSAKGNPGKFAFAMGLYGVAPTVMSTLYNVTNYPDEYKEIPQYVKDSNFVLVSGRNEKGTVDYITIPKANGVQYVANPVENFLSYMADTNSTSLGEMATHFLSSSLPVVGDGSTPSEVALKTIGSNLPQAIKPASENLLNKSFFKYDTKSDEAKAIVPSYLQKKHPADQSYEFTPTVYKKIGTLLNVSPLKVQNAMEGYLAGYTKIPTNVVDNIIKAGNGEKLDKNKIPLLRRFMQQTYETKEKKVLLKPEKEATLFGKADASDGKPTLVERIFNKKPKVVVSKPVTEIAWESDSGRKTTVKLASKDYSKEKGINAFKDDGGEIGKAIKIWDAPSDQVPDKQKVEAYKKLGFTPDDVRYAYKANFENDEKLAYIKSKNLSHDKLIESLTTGRVESVGGKRFASDGVLDELAKEGLISYAERGHLKKIKTDSKGIAQAGSGVGSGKGRKGRKPKFVKLVIPKAKQVKIKTVKLKRVKDYKLSVNKKIKGTKVKLVKRIA